MNYAIRVLNDKGHKQDGDSVLYRSQSFVVKPATGFSRARDREAVFQPRIEAWHRVER